MTALDRLAKHRGWVAALYALAVALVGFAHQPIRDLDDRALDLAAYALPDGSLPEICADRSGDGTGQHAVASPFCAACLLTGAPGLPALAATVLVIGDRAAQASLPAADVTADLLPDPAPPARAPPALPA